MTTTIHVAESNDNDVETTADVVIVGAGPVGMTLATELALAGVRVVILETTEHRIGQEKARAVGTLAAEALRRRGLSTRLSMPLPPGGGAGQRAIPFGPHFAWIPKLDFGSRREPSRNPAPIAQPELEALLSDHVEAFGIPVYRGHTVDELTSSDDSVVTSAQTPQGRRKFRSPYVVGCDGGRSVVRTLGHFDFPGVAPTSVGRIGRMKVEDITTVPADMEGPRGSFTTNVVDGWVYVRAFEPVPEDERGASTPVSIEEMRAAIQRITGADVAITTLDGPRRGYDHARQAATYRQGRLFLAGDAAHVHSPIGGQGLNLGLMDAVNLGWKLAAAVRGAVNAEDLLDSYTGERHPVGAATLRNILAQSALLAFTPHARAIRHIVDELLDIDEVKVYFSEMMSGTTIRYQLAHPTGNHPLLGGHIGDCVVDDTTLYSLMTDGRPLLIHQIWASDAAAVAQPWSDRVHIHRAVNLSSPGLSAALIRPDGVVVWAAEPRARADPATLVAALETWFGPAR